MMEEEEQNREDNPPAYSAATAEEIVTDATFTRTSESDDVFTPDFYPSKAKVGCKYLKLKVRYTQP